MKTRLLILVLLLVVGLAASPNATAQPQFTSSQLAEGLFLVHTAAPIPMPGGEPFSMNNLLLVQPDGVLLVDTLFPPQGAYPLFNVFNGLLNSLSGGRPVDTIVNTHWHFDHVGLNKPFRTAGTPTVLAHWRTPDLLLDYPCNDDIPGFCWAPFTDALYQPTGLLEGQTTLTLGGETVVLKTFENAHSGADVMVFFKQANVVATGDIYFGGMYPIIYRAGGGTINGVMAALHYLLARIDDNAVVVPSHGPVGNRESVLSTLQMLETSRRMVRQLIAAQLTEEEVMAHPSFAALDAVWGKGFISGPLFRRVLYREMIAGE